MSLWPNPPVNLSTSEYDDEVGRRRARLVAEAIASFDVYASNGEEPTTFHDSPAFAGTTYLSDVAARPARERRSIRPRVIRMMNDSDI